MSGTLRHIAINADDVAGTRHFYETVFGWRFSPWGPPGFFRIDATDEAGPGVHCALQERRRLGPARMTGPECTFGVDDLEATVDRVEAAGGRIVMDAFRIDGVGVLVGVEDPSQNVILVMRYDD